MNTLNHYQSEMRQIAQDAGKRKGIGGGLVAWLMMIVGVVVTGTMVSLRQNGVGPNKTCADAILPKGHDCKAG